MKIKNFTIFTDLDGTLLNHHDYSWDAARPALSKLAERNIPVILCTSKTAAEVTAIQTAMALTWPFIVENGSAIIFSKEHYEHKQNDYFFGKRYKDILKQLHTLRRHSGYPFTGFYDMSTAAVAAATGLTAQQAELSKKRLCSEPLLWNGDTEQLRQFEIDLGENGIRLLRGGRFFHAIDIKCGKGIALHWYMTHFQEGKDRVSVALGDGPNDTEMMEAADLAVIIPSLSGLAPAPRKNRIIHAEEPGPAGWNKVILELLDTSFS